MSLKKQEGAGKLKLSAKEWLKSWSLGFKVSKQMKYSRPVRDSGFNASSYLCVKGQIIVHERELAGNTRVGNWRTKCLLLTCRGMAVIGNNNVWPWKSQWLRQGQGQQHWEESGQRTQMSGCYKDRHWDHENYERSSVEKNGSGPGPQKSSRNAGKWPGTVGDCTEVLFLWHGSWAGVPMAWSWSWEGGGHLPDFQVYRLIGGRRENRGPWTGIWESSVLETARLQ